MRKFGKILRLGLCLSVLAVALSAPTSRAADPGPPSGLSVKVLNTPLPVTGTVSVGNLPATQSISGSVTITNTPSVTVANTPSVTVANTPLAVTGSVTLGTKVIADFEADSLDSSQHKFGPFDISQFSKIRLRVTANGSGSVIADIETDGLADFFSVDAGNVESRVYDIPGTSATIFLNGDPNITQVFVKLFGS
jgi:hypothetical protein